MARYLRLYVARFKGPRFDKLPLQVNQMSSHLAPQSDAALDGVSHWLRLSTLERGRRIELPLRANPYAEQFTGRDRPDLQLVQEEARLVHQGRQDL